MTQGKQRETFPLPNGKQSKQRLDPPVEKFTSDFMQFDCTHYKTEFALVSVLLFSSLSFLCLSCLYVSSVNCSFCVLTDNS